MNSLTTSRDNIYGQFMAAEKINQFYSQVSICVEGQEVSALLLSQLGVQTLLEHGKIPKRSFMVPPWVTVDEAMRKYIALTKATLKSGHGQFPMYRICCCQDCQYAEQLDTAGLYESVPTEVLTKVPVEPSLKLPLEVLRQALLEHAQASNKFYEHTKASDVVDL